MHRFMFMHDCCCCREILYTAPELLKYAATTMSHTQGELCIPIWFVQCDAKIVTRLFLFVFHRLLPERLWAGNVLIGEFYPVPVLEYLRFSFRSIIFQENIIVQGLSGLGVYQAIYFVRDCFSQITFCHCHRYWYSLQLYKSEFKLLLSWR